MTKKIKVSDYLDEHAPILVSTTVADIRKVYEILLVLAKVSKRLEKQIKKTNPTQSDIDKTWKVIQKAHLDCEKFISDFLNLDDDERQSIKTLDQQVLYSFVNSVASQFLDVASDSKNNENKPIGKVVYELENAVEDINYEENIAFTQFHILPDDFERQDFEQLQRALKAKAPEDRVQDPLKLLQSMGIQPGNI